MAKCPKDSVSLIIQLANSIITYKILLFFKSSASCSDTDESSISQRQYSILFAIGYSKLKTLSEIAKAQGQSTGSLSTIIKRMEAHGLIKKEYPQINEDSRKVYFCLTDKGSEMLKDLTSFILSEIDNFYFSLDTKNRTEFEKGFKLLKSLSLTTDEVEPLVNYGQKYQPLSVEILETIISTLNWASVNFSPFFNRNGNKCQSLTYNQFRILCNLYFFNNSAIPTLSHILGVSQSSLSTAIKSLTEYGYLKKERPRDGEDARKIYFYITEKGEYSVQQTMDKLYQVFIKIYDTLTEEAKENMHKGLECMYEVFQNLTTN